MKKLIALTLLTSTTLTACVTSNKVSTPTTNNIKIDCPVYLRAVPTAEPTAPDKAFVDKDAKTFLAGEYFPWAKNNAEKLKMARDWCLNPKN